MNSFNNRYYSSIQPLYSLPQIPLTCLLLPDEDEHRGMICAPTVTRRHRSNTIIIAYGSPQPTFPRHDVCSVWPLVAAAIRREICMPSEIDANFCWSNHPSASKSGTPAWLCSVRWKLYNSQLVSLWSAMSEF